MRIALTLVALVLAGGAAAAPVDRYSSFFVFGDSLSDNGNLFAATGGATPGAPYVNGRFSNGPVWAEGVAAEFAAQGSVTVNFAFGGAQAVTNGDPVPDLPLQLGIYGASVPGAALGPRPLASLWFGANDLFAALDAFALGTIGVGDVEAAGRAAADAVAAGATQLGLGGITDVVIFNLPDFGSLPAYALFQPGSVAAANAGTDAFNARLAQNIVGLRATGFTVIDIDTNALFDQLLANPASFGVLDATNPCFIPGFALCTPAEADALAFFDPVHPNATIHAAIADVVTARIAAVPVPLPGAMLVLGLAVLGVAGRRRAA